MVNAQSSVLKVGENFVAKTQTLNNRAQRKGELKTDFWAEAVCLKSPNNELNCTLNFGQEDGGKPLLSKHIGDILNVKNSPSHFAFVPGDILTYATVGV